MGDGSGKPLAVSLRASVDYFPARQGAGIHVLSFTGLRLALFNLSEFFAIAAGVIAITDDGDCGHRLVGNSPSKIRPAFLEQVP
jgi:hypothetical protein